MVLCILLPSTFVRVISSMVPDSFQSHILHLWERCIPKINPLITLAENGIRQILKPIENDRLTPAGLTAAQAVMQTAKSTRVEYR
jgi:hypothetical protein